MTPAATIYTPFTRLRAALPRVRALSAALIVTLLPAAAMTTPASAQNFRWPWEEPAPRPREQMRPPAPVPAPIPPPQASPQGSQWMQRNPICAQLEQRLVLENQKGAATRDALPKLEADIRQTQTLAQQSDRQLEKSDCYEYFLFSKTLRATKQCRDLASQAENAKRRVAELENQRSQLMGSGGRSYTDDIVRELARNNCGANYQQEASRGAGGGPGSGSVWQDGEGGGATAGFGSSQYATFRTVCVRLCDGYYFPISFSTLEGHFQQDADACQSKCAAPVELYYHPNPGGAMEQAISLKGHEPYTRLKSAFRYRKEFVQGCSCKEAEYIPPAGTAPLPVPGQQGSIQTPVPGRRAETSPPGVSTAR